MAEDINWERAGGSLIKCWRYLDPDGVYMTVYIYKNLLD